MKYLLIFEDQTIKTAIKFDEDWKYSIDAGILTVIKFDGSEFFDLYSDGKWYLVDAVK